MTQLREKLRDKDEEISRISNRPEPQHSNPIVFEGLEKAATATTENQELKTKLWELAEELEVQKSKYLDQLDQIESMQKETAEKDKSIFQLQQQMKAIREQTGRIPAMPRDQKIEFLTEQISAHQSQNSFLLRTLQRLESDKKATLAANRQTMELYKETSRDWKLRYEDILQRVLREEKVALDYLQSVEQLKRKYFYTLAVGMKLTHVQQGRAPNFDVNVMYEVASEMHWSEWHEWIEKEMEMLVKKEATHKRASFSAPNQFHPPDWA